MDRLLRLAVLHQDFVSRLWLTVALHEDADVRVVIFAGTATELLKALERVPVDLVLCGGDYARLPAKAMRRYLWLRGLPVVTVRNADSPPAYWEEHAAADRECSGDNVRAVIRNFVRAAK